MDVEVQNHGTIVLLVPCSDKGEAWVNDNIGQDNGYQPYWPTAVIEPRYAEDILEGIIGDGLEVWSW